MFSFPVFFVPIVSSKGSVMYFLAILLTSEGMVAENSQVFFSSGVVDKILSISS